MKALERHEALIDISFIKIMELGEKEGERSQVACEDEKEENKSLVNKKDFEDQWEILDQFNFGALSLFSLSLSLSYSWIPKVFLEHSWRVKHTWSFRAIRKRKSSKK